MVRSVFHARLFFQYQKVWKQRSTFHVDHVQAVIALVVIAADAVVIVADVVEIAVETVADVVEIAVETVVDAALTVTADHVVIATVAIVDLAQSADTTTVQTVVEISHARNVHVTTTVTVVEISSSANTHTRVRITSPFQEKSGRGFFVVVICHDENPCACIYSGKHAVLGTGHIS
jgi:hypothetical protein